MNSQSPDFSGNYAPSGSAGTGTPTLIESLEFLQTHRMFLDESGGGFEKCLRIGHTPPDRKTKRAGIILRVGPRVKIRTLFDEETGMPVFEYANTFDSTLTTIATSFERAVILLAKKVLLRYGA